MFPLQKENNGARELWFLPCSSSLISLAAAASVSAVGFPSSLCFKLGIMKWAIGIQETTMLNHLSYLKVFPLLLLLHSLLIQFCVHFPLKSIRDDGAPLSLFPFFIPFLHHPILVCPARALQIKFQTFEQYETPSSPTFISPPPFSPRGEKVERDTGIAQFLLRPTHEWNYKKRTREEGERNVFLPPCLLPLLLSRQTFTIRWRPTKLAFFKM